jgi:hypothetical protein
MRSFFFTLLVIVFLSGCAVQKYDSDEYKKIVTATVTLSPKICSDNKTLKTNLNNFADQLDYIALYESGLSNNGGTNTMLAGVQDETVRFQNIVNNTPSVSWSYCDSKIAGVRHTLNLIIKAEGSKMQ